MSRYIESWDIEDNTFWEAAGKKIAKRNLLISIPCLICAFAVWLYWSIITVEMKNLGFPFDTDQLFTLTAIAGLTGATLRIPNSFATAISGGRNVISLTTGLLIIPALGTGIALQDINTPYATFVVLAILSGIGGGNFASSMSNISFFFPKRMQGVALGLNAGFGNLGVSIMQVLIPFVMTYSLFGAIAGEGISLISTSGEHILGAVIYIQNSALIWVPILVLLSLAAWFGMNNLSTATPSLGSTRSALLKMLGILSIGMLTSGFVSFLLLKLKLNMWIALLLTIILTIAGMKALPGDIRGQLKSQFAIFNNKHTWIMAYLYMMTFGSFIGYSAAFPLLIQVVFGELPGGSANPGVPNPFVFAWLGPLVGSVIRPFGGWMADKVGGAKILHWNTTAMIMAALGVAFFIRQTTGSEHPEQFFLPFLVLFLILFITTGIGNGATFRMVPIIFNPTEAAPVLGWISAIAAYGIFIIPNVFGQQVTAGTPANALYGFTVFYFTCLLINWHFYARKNAEIVC